MKVIVTGAAARKKLLDGATILVDSVKDTLGPWGSNGILEKGLRVTNDGYTIAAQVESEDEIENLAIRHIREATNKTNEKAGDGTTTSTILAHAILKDASRLLGKEGVVRSKTNGASLVRQLETEKDSVIAALQESSREIASESELFDSCLVSTENEHLAKLIAEAQWKIGKDGVIVVDEHIKRESEIEYVSGIHIDNGVSALQVINNPQNQALEVDDVYVILTNHTVQSLVPFKNLLDSMNAAGRRNIAIVARAFTSDAILTCQENCKSGFMMYPINAPYTDQSEVMKDMAASLGGRYIDQEETALEDIQLTDVGFAKRIVAKAYESVFTGEDNDETRASRAARVKELESKLEGAISSFEDKNIRTRIAQLTNGFAILRIGSVSDSERKRLRDKAEDAVNAARAALQEGTVPGAGLSFKEIADKMDDSAILKRPLQAIHQQIMLNAPEDYQIPEWVRDPVKVLRIALENAVSVGGSLATAAMASATKIEKPCAMHSSQEQG
jgi:chaperonin GroEL